jgi:catechol 2,3-dioxygenase-like lactoylglutathione lyase family enzyme
MLNNDFSTLRSHSLSKVHDRCKRMMLRSFHMTGQDVPEQEPTEPDGTAQDVPAQIATGAVHHLRLAVSDVERSASFYTQLLGFQRAVELGSQLLLGNGSVILALTPPAPEALSAAEEKRVGLDQLSFFLPSRSDLLNAVAILDAQGIEHSEIKDLGPDLGLYVLAFRDLDNIELELTAPYDRL